VLALLLVLPGCGATEIDCGTLPDSACLAAVENANAALHGVEPDASFASIKLRGLSGFEGVLRDGRSVNSSRDGTVVIGER
jgi:hypothetical protein